MSAVNESLRQSYFLDLLFLVLNKVHNFDVVVLDDPLDLVLADSLDKHVVVVLPARTEMLCYENKKGLLN